MERARQLLGDLLIAITLVVIAGGAYLGSHYAITDEMVPYSGTYPPQLEGVVVPAAYESVLTISLDVPGGLLLRQLHGQYGNVLLVGLVVWAVLGRFRYALPAFALAVAAAFSGWQLGEGNPPVPLWFAAHLAATLAMAAILVVSSRREAKERPVSIGYVAGVLGLLVVAALI
ncbi:hypothetical protein FDA94_20205 [Herbidospora galbida]|uniref:Cytochrome bc1 reductase complex subunit QcrB n=1 Tax=Herbidospora galbida TaxID=2575442 RepID=A0A4V5UZA9_9ACTN|nr:hypothetical protein [Herbidospora galbida]TKK86783.1 hypothetical protein FDA94_20205 [Herbidospora galbida]